MPLSKARIPNFLTLLRMLCIPLLAATFYLPAPWYFWLPCAVFAFASLTDFLDGYLARKWQVQSESGALWDPIADKLVVAVALVYLLQDGRVWIASALIIFLRELLVSGLREYLGSRQIPMPVTRLAKWKTATQMIGLVVMLPALPGSQLLLAGNGLLAIAALLTAITGVQYTLYAVKSLNP